METLLRCQSCNKQVEPRLISKNYLDNVCQDCFYGYMAIEESLYAEYENEMEEVYE